ncbi:MAG TPA: hypothetical protein VJK07_01035 [Candidatus Nanoarchaeia archaeon]|nr:hypothetical protein [Candidatus Nanoarchaeia archaeon]
MKYAVISIFSLIVLSALVSAEMTITHTETVYNLEDTLSLTAIVRATQNANDFLRISLHCGEQDVELYRAPLSLGAGASREMSLEVVLTKAILGSLYGICTVRGNYGAEHTETSRFELSKNIDISLTAADSPLEPGQNVVVRGNAHKANGDAVRGHVNAINSALNLRFDGLVTNGSFALNFTIPESMPVGRHVIALNVYETDNRGERTNEGTIETTLIIKSVLRSVDVSLNQTESAMPNGTIVYRVYAYDQTGQAMTDDARISISQPDGDIFAQQLVHTGESISFVLPQHAQPGYWKIEAVIDGISNRRLFYVDEYERASFDLVNATLAITNIGNVPYKKTIEIVIGEHRELRDVELAVNGLKKYTLRAPDSTYSIKVYDGVEDFFAENVPLTGRTVDIGEVRFMTGTLKSVWWIALLVIAGLAVATNVYLRYRTPAQHVVEQLPISATHLRALSSGSAMGGVKEQAVGLAIKLEGTKGEDVIMPLLADAQKRGVRMYVHGDHRVVLFSPRLTRSVNPEMLAVKLAKDVEKVLTEHNQKMKPKVSFGIGAARGEMISEMKNGEFSFTATTSFIPAAKRLASASEQQTLISHELYTTVMNLVKAEKSRSADAWRVLALRDRSSNDSFIAGFLKRQD